MPKSLGSAGAPKWHRGGLGPFPKYQRALTCGRSFEPGPVFIYALLDPHDDTVRYVGKTTRPAQRLAMHRKGDTTNYQLKWWLAGLTKAGGPKMVTLTTCMPADWEAAEQAWISAYAARGELYNWTAGGRSRLPDRPLGKRRAAAQGLCPVCRRLREAGKRLPRCQLCRPDAGAVKRLLDMSFES